MQESRAFSDGFHCPVSAAPNTFGAGGRRPPPATVMIAALTLSPYPEE